ncbi:hypothetical protein CDAR_411731 [Caerostris darwini]|uniref:Uncharacterized protein n=1 Tax=Caerostris darwini TaxID=1538125 RepID=A0AAV4MHE8_9ARAC|nr:hypothetical protein CDAR_411731 [Caerostris darwini]
MRTCPNPCSIKKADLDETRRFTSQYLVEGFRKRRMRPPRQEDGPLLAIKHKAVDSGELLQPQDKHHPPLRAGNYHFFKSCRLLIYDAARV